MTDELKGKAKGGKAAAQKMTAEERKARSEKANEAKRLRAEERKEIDLLPKATHGDPAHPLKIGELEIECYVLEDGTRVLTQASFLEALGRHRKARVRHMEGEDRIPAILYGKAINPFITKETLEKTTPVIFRQRNGVKAYGFRAELLPEVCEVYLKARDAGVLPANQRHVADQAYMLIRGLAHVGIIALVDEATGFQYDRPRRDLEEQLKKFLSESLRRWVQTFPTAYFKHLCRLRNVELRPDMKLPQYFGHLTNNLVYRRIAPGLLMQLKERRAARGSRSNKLHPWLSLEVGVPELLLHLGTVITVMKQHTDYEKFERALNEVAPIYPETPGLFDDPADWEPRG